VTIAAIAAMRPQVLLLDELIIGQDYRGLYGEMLALEALLADRLENLVGLAATTGEVDNGLFDEANDRLVLDKEMRHRIQENNPYALLEVVEWLLEAEVRGYWEADPDKLEQLKRIYLQIEGDLEGVSAE
jgi:cobalamin biosynthesis Mg chelatase CobN